MLLRHKLYFLFAILLGVTPVAWAQTGDRQTLLSPDGNIEIAVELLDRGVFYSVRYGERPVVRASRLGFEIKGQPQLAANLTLDKVQRSSRNQTWQQVWGERREVLDHHNELRLSLSEKDGLQRKFDLVFRAFDGGIGFRYDFPEQPNLGEFAIEEELTEFSLAQNYQAWWIPAYRNQRYEYQYLKSALSSVDVAHTPLTLVDEGIAIAIHEAALVDYASMTLRNVNDNTITFRADLVPWADGTRVYAQTPMQTPWRTIQIASNPVELLNSDLSVNLNEPNKLGDVSAYVKPGKYMGVWWEMHIGHKDWSPGPDQSATTERVKQYIDFAAQHDIDGVLVEGWNKGWEGEWWQRKPTFLFDQPVVGFDIQAASDYARSRGRELVGHHETAAGIAHYEAQMEKAFAYYQKLGIHSVKMGYVGTRLEGKEWHHGQFMVRHFHKVVETAARYQVMVNAHETIKDTGLRRTYPNLMTRECVRGMEYNGGSPDTGNLPNHTVIIPFTRGLSGPIDFTPGIFNFDYQEKRPFNRVPSTLANQLSLYLTLYSPLQMAADLPENYAGHPAFQFIDDVPTDWTESRALQGEIGEFLVIARKDRNSEDWYLGATSNEVARELDVPLDFLDSGNYEATIYQDGAQAHWRDNPEAYEIVTKKVTAKKMLHLKLAPGGGAAIRLRKI